MSAPMLARFLSSLLKASVTALAVVVAFGFAANIATTEGLENRADFRGVARNPALGHVLVARPGRGRCL